MLIKLWNYFILPNKELLILRNKMKSGKGNIKVDVDKIMDLLLSSSNEQDLFKYKRNDNINELGKKLKKN